MKTSGWVAVIIIIIIIAGGAWWYYSNTNGAYGPANFMPPNPSAPGQVGSTTPPAPSSPGQSGQPGPTSATGDGTGVSQNLILGTQTSASLGSYLTAYNGMTVYSYSPDKQTPGQSSCTGSCAANWPPYTVASASDINVSAVTTGAVSTIKRADGSLQVTYDGVPLYFYSKDAKPGDTNGQGVGGVWYVVKS